MFKQKESIVVLVLDGGGIIEDRNVGVVHLIITDHHEGGDENAFVFIGGCAGGGLADAVESLVDLVNKLLMADVSCADNDDIVAEVVRSLELSEISRRNLRKNISVSLNGLAHHVVT